MNFTPTQLKILAFSAAAARLNQPVWFNVIQQILEMKHEENARARSVGTRSLGRDPRWNKRPSTELMIRLLLGVLPDGVRRILWRSLSERYALGRN